MATDENVTLSFDRTIDRRKVASIRGFQVFITDVHGLGDGRVALAAQLPTCHRYFNDHGSMAAADPLLIMEVCRQAGLATAYELGVSTNVVLITEEWDLRVAESGTWSTRRTRDRPAYRRAGSPGLACAAAALALEPASSASSSKGSRSRPCLARASSWAMKNLRFSEPRSGATHLRGRRTWSIAGSRAGSATHRRQARSTECSAGRPGTQRWRSVGTGRIAAGESCPVRPLLRPRHDASSHRGRSAVDRVGRDCVSRWGPRSHLSRLAGKFKRFAELDSTVTVRAALLPAEAAAQEFHVVVEQDGELVAEIDLTMTRSSGRS